MQEGSSRRILKTWLALELLEAGAPYDKPTDLANGSSRISLPLDDSLPWEAAGFVPPQKPGKTYYEVVLGSIRLDASYDLLYRSFPDTKPDRTSSKRFAPLATFLLDDAGALTAGNDITISSFCWAYPKALRKDFSSLYQWSKVSMRLKENLAELLERKDEEGKPLPVTAGIVGAAYAWLVEALGLEPELCVPPSFAFRIRCDASKKDTPELLLLNSFYLDDLSMAIKLRRKGDLPPLVSWYLGEHRPQAPIDILSASGALERSLAPMSFPLVSQSVIICRNWSGRICRFPVHNPTS